jgi:hypothetical protein
MSPDVSGVYEYQGLDGYGYPWWAKPQTNLKCHIVGGTQQWAIRGEDWWPNMAYGPVGQPTDPTGQYNGCGSDEPPSGWVGTVTVSYVP